MSDNKIRLMNVLKKISNAVDQEFSTDHKNHKYLSFCLQTIYEFIPNHVLEYFTTIEDSIDLNKIISSILNDEITVSIAMIVLNEERCLKRCIDSIEGIADEIIVIDTGSTDKTLEIINQYQSIKLYNFIWNDDFSEARNYALSKCTSNIIFFIDADEYLSNNFDNEKIKCFFKVVIALGLDKNYSISPMIIEESTNDKYDNIGRIFSSNHSFRFMGYVHECLIFPDNAEIPSISSNIIIFHDGYKQNIISEKNKKERNLALNRKNLEVAPENFRWNYFAVRDGFDVLPKKEIEQNILNIFFVDKKFALEKIIITPYTNEALELLCKIYYNDKNYNKIEQIKAWFKKENLFSVKIEQFFILARLYALELDFEKLLQMQIDLRKNSFRSTISNETNSLIDFILCVLLDKNCLYKQSIQYFNGIHEELKKFPDLELLSDKYLYLYKLFINK